MRIIAIVNQKGGCGKTTTAINLAALSAKRGSSTLLVDMDPQSHCAAGLGIPEEAIEGGTTSVMRGEAETIEPSELCWEIGHRFHVLPSTVMLSAVEARAHEDSGDVQMRLGMFLSRCQDRFDTCIIDCPPALGLLTFAALRAATEALIPVETGYFSLQGARRQWDTIEALVNRMGRTLPRWIVPTIHDPGSKLAAKILETLTQEFEPSLAPLVIREHESLREAASLGQPVCDFEPGGSAERDFASLLDWLDSLPQPETNSIPAVARPSSRAGEIMERLQGIRSEVPPTADRLAPLHSGSPIESDDGYGAVMTSHGVRFRQPGRPDQIVAVCGDFNGWSTSATPLRWAASESVFEAIVPLPSGTYRYQLVIDGRPGPDPFNIDAAPSGEEGPSTTSTLLVESIAEQA
ncbi:MAG: AAA family ATPase [Phycisphaerales bacterium]|nr:AAA family ATPase [Phycisphaerales bacterium]